MAVRLILPTGNRVSVGYLAPLDMATAAGPRGPAAVDSTETGSGQLTDTADHAALTAATCDDAAPYRSVAALTLATRAPA